MSNNTEKIKLMYPKGTRLRLIAMDDPFPIEHGTTGSVNFVDDAGQIHMYWDDGRSLALVPGVDKFEIIND